MRISEFEKALREAVKMNPGKPTLALAAAAAPSEFVASIESLTKRAASAKSIEAYARTPWI